MKPRYVRKMNTERLARLLNSRGWTLLLYGCGRWSGYPQRAQIMKQRFVFTIRTDQAATLRSWVPRVKIMERTP